MKTTAKTLAFGILITVISLSSCKSSKNSQTSTTTKTTTTKEKPSDTQTTVTEKKIITTEKKTTTTVTNSNSETDASLSATPPAQVEKTFKTDYPAASEVKWSQQVPLVKTEDKNAKNYKVNFQLGENKNSIIYSDKGQLIESKTQILPDQLPPNIYKAIMKQYPDAHIASAYTYKSSRINGSYSVVINTSTPNSEKELLLTENGAFVE